MIQPHPTLSSAGLNAPAWSSAAAGADAAHDTHDAQDAAAAQALMQQLQARYGNANGWATAFASMERIVGDLPQDQRELLARHVFKADDRLLGQLQSQRRDPQAMADLLMQAGARSPVGQAGLSTGLQPGMGMAPGLQPFQGLAQVPPFAAPANAVPMNAAMATAMAAQAQQAAANPWLPSSTPPLAFQPGQALVNPFANPFGGFGANPFTAAMASPFANPFSNPFSSPFASPFAAFSSPFAPPLGMSFGSPFGNVSFSISTGPFGCDFNPWGGAWAGFDPYPFGTFYCAPPMFGYGDFGSVGGALVGGAIGGGIGGFLGGGVGGFLGAGIGALAGSLL